MVRAHLRSRIMTGTAGAVRLLGSLGLLRRPGLRQGHAKQVVPHPKARLRSLTGARSKAIVLRESLALCIRRGGVMVSLQTHDL